MPGRLSRRGSECSLAIAVLLMVGMTGCAPPAYHDFGDFMRKPRPIVGGKPYVIAPPDTIRFIAPNAPEINNVATTLRSDGYITVYLLGDVFAAGKTPTQLASEIEEKMKKYYLDVHVQIEVTGFNSQKYYVAGELPGGPRQYNGTDTVLDAVLKSGVSRTAWPEYLVVLRPNENHELIRKMRIDATEMYAGGWMRYNAVLEEGDIVYMPINPVAAIGVFFQNLLSPVQPVVQAAQTPAQIGSSAVIP